MLEKVGQDGGFVIRGVDAQADHITAHASCIISVYTNGHVEHIPVIQQQQQQQQQQQLDEDDDNEEASDEVCVQGLFFDSIDNAVHAFQSVPIINKTTLKVHTHIKIKICMNVVTFVCFQIYFIRPN
jgi:hypothetical protein